jgi:heptosyltransferase-1
MVLPWAADEECARAKRLADAMPSGVVAPALGLADLAAVLAGAAAAVGVDTGLTHLSAALGVPTLGIYGATDPEATGINARTPMANLGGMGGFPSVEEVAEALAPLAEPDAHTKVRRPA